MNVASLGGLKSSDSIYGIIGIDTAICLEYPISGSLTVIVRGEEITITFRFPFDRSVASGRLLVKFTTFHWDYSRGLNYLYSSNGINWTLLSEVGPPGHGKYNTGGWNGDLPAMFLGASDIWLEARLYAYGPTAYVGGSRCNTAQLSR